MTAAERTSSGTRAPVIGWRIYRAVAIGFIGLKVALLVLAHPFMDEAYYWLWGQHLTISYFDHPPLIGWTQMVASILGWNVVSFRLFVFLTLIGDLALLYGFARHFAGAAWRDTFWASAAIFATTPILFVTTNLALPDHLLVLFTLAAVYCVLRFNAAWDAGAPRWRFLYLAAVAIGCATLTKYTGAFLAVGVVLTLAWHRRLLGVFRSPHFYLGALLILAMQVPVLIWNLQHDFASFRYITGGRNAVSVFDFEGLKGYLLGIPLVLSPFLVWPVLRFATRRDRDSLYARILFWMSTAAFLVASFFAEIIVHYNLIAYVAALPFLAREMRSRFLVAGHVLFGLLVAALLAFNTTIAPVTSLIGPPDATSAWNFGWDEVAAEVDTVARREGTDFIASMEYPMASLLALALHNPEVVSLAARVETFDFWFDPESRKGQTAIVVADNRLRMSDDIRRQFASIEEASRVTIKRLGRPIDTYVIYIARAYSPPSH